MPDNSTKILPNITFKKSIFLSIVMHLLIFQAATLIDFEKILGVMKHKRINEIEFEIIEDNKKKYEKNSNTLDYKNTDNSSISDESIISNTSATNGNQCSKAGNITTRRQQFLIAVLDEMVGLKSPFNFITQPFKADSSGAFSPIQGFAPDTESLSRDLNSGILKVAGFGNGDCPPRGGGIVK